LKGSEVLKFRMNQKVRILKNRKMDGRYNVGNIYGIEKIQDAFYLGYRDKEEYKRRFNREKYKVVYFDCVTNNACEEWFFDDELESFK
jgi:hypothetical protein